MQELARISGGFRLINADTKGVQAALGGAVSGGIARRVPILVRGWANFCSAAPALPGCPVLAV